MSWPFGLAFAFGSAVATSVGFLMRYRGAVAAPDVDVRRPVWTVVELFKRKWWAIGFGVAVVAWLLHVVSLKLAPLSLVQAAIASSFVGLGVAADRWFGLQVTKRQWVGIGLATLGLALLGGMAPEAKPAGAQSDYGQLAAIVFEAALAACAIALAVAPNVGPLRRRAGIRLGAAAGLLFTVSHVAIKAITGDGSLPQSVLSGWPAVAVAAFATAFFASARSLQLGEAVPVIAITGAASNVTAIASGIVVFGDPIGSTPAVVGARIVGFLLVAASAVLMPAPVGAARDLAERETDREEPERAPRERRFARSDASVAAG